ncbi:MAG: tyrosine-type recombinase/integrase, partial [Ktedonobacteraceae bacterium]|nr:tyrosine-type recombinase/integrase [Ktedonobacteraceae bacterium]
MQDAQPPAIVDAGALDSLDQVETDHLSMQAAALDWLKTKAARSESKKTLTAYRTTLGQFDAYLQGQGCTLDADPRRVARYAQEWAFHTERNAPLSSSTINQRFAILSSFYKFAVKYGACEKNPIEYTERPPRHIEHAAPYLDDDYVSQQMQGIDTRTPEGKRDKALISLALTTGRRASELTGLCWKDLELRGKRMVAHWRCKGKKTMRDQLQARTIAVLLEYLQAEYGANLQRIKPESPVFVSYSNNHRGGPLSI